MKKHRILLIHNYYQQPGGEDVVFAAERDLLLANGHDVRVYTDTNDKIKKMGKLEGARNAIWSFSSAKKIEELIIHRRPDVAHVHNTWMMLSPSIFSTFRKYGIPVVQTLHNYRLLCPSAVFFRDSKICEDCMSFPIPLPGIYHSCYRNSRSQTATVSAMLSFHRLVGTWQKQISCFIALTEFARLKFIEGGLPKQKIFVKPNFVSSPDEYPKSEEDYALFVGRLCEEKGIEILLSAWKFLYDIPLKIVGDGPLREKVKDFVDDRANIRYLGQIKNKSVLTLMANARFLVFPSLWYEGFPMSVIESFSCSTPVISTSLGGMPEIIHDRDIGLLFIEGDAVDFSSKIRWLWNHPEESARMGRNARRTYEEKYSPERNYQMLLEIYEKAIANHR